MIYVVCILSVLLLSYIADRKQKYICLFLSALILSLFCGLRGIGTGVDTGHYFNFMSYIRGSGISYGSDIGFSLLSYLMMGVFNNPYYPLVVFAFITNYLIVYRLWDFRNEASFVLMMLVYMTWQYSYGFNIVRQFMAIAIVFWGTRYIERGNYIRYIVFNILAATIHTSALLCFSFLFVTFGYKAKKKKYKIIAFGAALLIVLIGIGMFRNNIIKYEGYFSNANNAIHGMTIFKICCAVMVAFSNRIFSNDSFSISKQGKYIPMQRQIPIMYMVGLLLSSLGMWFTFLNRIGFYFMVFEMPFWGQVVRAKKNKVIYWFLILFIVGYKLLTTLITGDNADNLFYYHSFLNQHY